MAKPTKELPWRLRLSPCLRFRKAYFHRATARPLVQIDGEIKGFLLPLLVSLQDQVKLTLPLMFCLLEVDQ